MKSIINDIKDHTPMYFDGYYYIKTQKICIPFSNLTIHGIEKDIFHLDPFFLSVMQLAAEEITDLGRIADILGMSDDVFNEAVADMAHIDYVSPSEEKITLTDKGKNALKQNTRVERKHIDLKNVFVDLITGKVHEDITCTNLKGRYIPLEPVVNIDNEYFSQHFKEIKDLHRLRQKQYQINENAPIEKELEKITGYEQSIVYVEKELYIYRSIESDELQFRLNDDDVESSYQTQFFKQFNQELINGNQRFFFENVKKYSEFPDRFSPDPELLKQTENIRKVILSTASNDEKEEAYLQRHYALNDSEYVSCITNLSRSFKFEYILIVCFDNINILLTDSFCSRLEELSENIPVFIVYKDNEGQRNRESINRLFPKEERGKKLYLIPQVHLDKKLGKQENCICYYPRMIVNITKHTAVTEFEYRDSPGRIAYSAQIYDFDKKSIRTAVEKIIEICPQIKEHIEDTSSKKSVFKNNTVKNVTSSDSFKSFKFSKSNKTPAGYGKKHPWRSKRDKQ